MGRSKGVHINTLAKALVLKAGFIFSTDFKHNKDIIKKLGLYMESKPEQSKLAGAITAMASKAAKIEAEEAASKAATEKASQVSASVTDVAPDATVA